MCYRARYKRGHPIGKCPQVNNISTRHILLITKGVLEMKTTNHTNHTAISQSELKQTRNGNYRIPKAVSKELLYNMVLELIQEDYQREPLSSAKSAISYLTLKLSHLDFETFSLIYLDSQHRVIELEQLFSGTIDSASVYPREVIKGCLHNKAAAVILCHNHPSGIPEPSNADKQITERIKDALELIDVRVLDHIIIAGGRSVSFAERGLL